MNKRVEIWLKSLMAATLSGAANSVLAVVGIGTANAVGIAVPRLDLKQVGAVCISGAIVGAAAYLKKSPVPPDSTGETDFVQKPMTTKTGTQGILEERSEGKKDSDQ